jgi:hypothetical protein
MIKINSFDDLIQFINNHDLTKDQICKLVQYSMKSIFIDIPDDKMETIRILKNHYNEWKGKKNPIFINLDISVRNDYYINI